MTKTQLRKRWKDQHFIEQLPIPCDRAPRHDELRNLDLRGVPKLANGEPLHHFKIYGSDANGIDLSFGDGALQISSSTVKSLLCEEFKFDRASWFSRSVFTNCRFQRARLRLNATDCEFIDCDFALSTFAGGFSEYGFTRCTFRNCSLQSARWKGTFFKACTFDACDMTRFQVIDSVITAIKYCNCDNFNQDIFTDCEMGVVREVA